MFLLLVVLVFYLLPIIPALAQDAAKVTPGTDTAGGGKSKWIAEILTAIVMLFISGVGKIVTIFIGILVGVAGFNDFIDSRAVAIGWVVVRDVTNIFFVIIMLIIAFGTLFNIQTYEYKKLLPKLVIAAILVNFSKMIVGVAIDMGQVIMLVALLALMKRVPLS